MDEAKATRKPRIRGIGVEKWNRIKIPNPRPNREDTQLSIKDVLVFI